MSEMSFQENLAVMMMAKLADTTRKLIIGAGEGSFEEHTIATHFTQDDQREAVSRYFFTFTGFPVLDHAKVAAARFNKGDGEGGMEVLRNLQKGHTSEEYLLWFEKCLTQDQREAVLSFCTVRDVALSMMISDRLDDVGRETMQQLKTLVVAKISDTSPTKPH